MGTIFCLADGSWGTSYEFYYNVARGTVVSEVVYPSTNARHWSEDDVIYTLNLDPSLYDMVISGGINLYDVDDSEGRWESFCYEGDILSLCEFKP